MFRIFLAAASTAIAAACAAVGSPDETGAAISAEAQRLQAERGVAGVGIVVVSGDEVILAEGFGETVDGEPFTAETACGLYSATKALSAFTLASLVEDGILDIDQSIGEAWDEAPEHWADIPVWRLYNHTSGIPMIVNQPVFGERAPDPAFGNAEIVEIVAAQPLDYEPGAYSRYRQSGYALAEWLAERSTGETWPVLVDVHLTGPAGADATRHTQLSNNEKTVPMISSAGGYETTPSDMAAIFRALNSGAVAGRSELTGLLLDQRYVHDTYGLGLIHETVAGTETIGHRGGGARGNIRYAPEAGVGVMTCTDQIENGEVIISIADMAMQAMLTGELPGD